MSNEKNKEGESSSNISRKFLLSFIPFIVFSLSFFPVVIYGSIIMYFLNFRAIWQLILIPFFVYFGIIIVVFSLLFISGSVIKLFNITYNSGKYKYEMSENNSFKWMIICALYTPCRKILEIFPIGNPRNSYYRLLGMKLGKNTLVGGTIKDPCVTEIGSNTTIGEYSVIYGHIHNYEQRTITIEKVIIGNNCVIGAGAIIMPGCIIQDNVVVAAGALVTKKQTLEKGKLYGGIPAKEIKK